LANEFSVLLVVSGRHNYYMIYWFYVFNTFWFFSNFYFQASVSISLPRGGCLGLASASTVLPLHRKNASTTSLLCWSMLFHGFCCVLLVEMY